MKSSVVDDTGKTADLMVNQHVSSCYITGWWCNNHLEKYEFVNGKDDIQYRNWKIKFMFQTTNQSCFVMFPH